MAFTICSTTRVKRVAKDLKQALAANGIGKSYLACLDVSSQFYGYQGYQALERAVGRGDGIPSRDDELVDAGEAARRRAFQVAVLTSEGLAPPVAGAVVDAVRPTGRAVKAPRRLPHPTVPPHSDAAPVGQVVSPSSEAGRRVRGLGRHEGTPSFRTYLVEEDGRLTAVSNARLSRLMDGDELWPEKAGREFRFIDAHIETIGRQPSKLRGWIGLYRSFDDTGRLNSGVAEAMRLVAAGQTGRSWPVSEAQVGDVMRRLKLID